MKIGIFGNTNNYPLLLALGLRRLGHDVVLAVNSRERLHRPESRWPALATGYPDWILDCSSLDEEAFLSGTPAIGDVLNFLTHHTDGLVLNHVGPSLLEFCALPAVSLMTGSDLTYYADPGASAVRLRGCDPAYLESVGARLATRRWQEFAWRQRAGLRASRAVFAPPPGLVADIDAALEASGVQAGRRDFLYMADTLRAWPVVPPGGPRLRVLNGARLNWRQPTPEGFSSLDHKGTDILLRGVAACVAQGVDLELVLVRKGLDVEATAALVEALGLEGHVVWQAESSLHDFQVDMARADVVCDQVGDSFPGMVALDAMAQGKPVIANFRPEVFGDRAPTAAAACQARTPGEVAAQLTRLAAADARAAIGAAARTFARTRLSPEANARRVLARLFER
ncbi:MAG: glycosyltransferase [Vicinamibacterales bacterium]